MTESHTAHVLDVGQCSPDHHAIKSMITQYFNAAVDRATLAGEAMDALRQKQYHLVLVNRILDKDGSEGMELIRQIKENQQLRIVPIMLVSNYADAQSAAAAAGAEQGFGKAELHNAATLERLEQFLPRKT